MNAIVKRNDLIYPELSYTIIGCAYEVFDELGAGHTEKIYQKAYAIALRNKSIKFKEQVYYPVIFEEKMIGKGYLDFLIEEKIIIELKKDGHFSKAHIEQVLNYLKLSGLPL